MHGSMGAGKGSPIPCTVCGDPVPTSTLQTGLEHVEHGTFYDQSGMESKISHCRFMISQIYV